jgi:hypothetical protein
MQPTCVSDFVSMRSPAGELLRRCLRLHISVESYVLRFDFLALLPAINFGQTHDVIHSASPDAFHTLAITYAINEILTKLIAAVILTLPP